MARYEYKVEPAPMRPAKAKGVRSNADRHAHALSHALNAAAEGGWEFVRAERLLCEERAGLFRKSVTVEHCQLVFRREIVEPESRIRPVAPAANAAAPSPAPPPAPMRAVRQRAEPSFGDTGRNRDT